MTAARVAVGFVVVQPRQNFEKAARPPSSKHSAPIDRGVVYRGLGGMTAITLTPSQYLMHFVSVKQFQRMQMPKPPKEGPRSQVG